MTSLASLLHDDPTLLAADAALEAQAALEAPRTYLGMSQIGDSCSRKLWYSHRWAKREKFDAITLKRFADGHRTEALIIDRLNLIEGLELVSMDGANQIRVTDHDGHFSGHLDGTITGILQAPKAPHVFEVKCVGDKNFAKFKKCVTDLGEKKALQAFNETYYAQGQAYMHYMGYKRHYIVVATAGGRDWASARTEYDPAYAMKLVAKAKRIISSDAPLDKISKDPAWWECRFCTFSDICHKQEMPDRGCRTCAHSTAIENGQWRCERFGKVLSAEEQLAGCPAHIMLPSLVPGEVISADDKSITYRLNNGDVWTDGEA